MGPSNNDIAQVRMLLQQSRQTTRQVGYANLAKLFTRNVLQSGPPGFKIPFWQQSEGSIPSFGSPFLTTTCILPQHAQG